MHNEFLMLKKISAPEELEKCSAEFLNKIAVNKIAVGVTSKAAPKIAVGVTSKAAPKTGLKVFKKAAPAALSAAFYGKDILNTFKNSFRQLSKPIELPKI
jgi:hypothetical protein